jgi:putative membrane protein
MNWKSVLPVLILAPAVAFAQDKGPTDPQIAHIVVTANQIDIDAGKIAKSKSKNKEVKQFAQQMITDHGAVNKQAVALAKKLGVKPEDNDTSKALKKGAQENVANLKKLSGAAFDKAYVDHEVAYHEQVLDAIDKVLVPSAQNAELKGLIEKVRPAFVAHLEHAKHIQADLGKSSGKK